MFVAVQDLGEKNSTQVSPGHIGEELLQIFPRQGQSRLTKMFKFLLKCTNFSSKCANSLPW